MSNHQCAMHFTCSQPVTHIGEKGFVYCAEHAKQRRSSGRERCRKLRQWEIELLLTGRQVPSYKPIAKRDAFPCVLRFIQAATTHGECDDPDHEVGDLQEYLRIAWSLMTPEQHRRFAADERVIELLECAS